MRIPRHRLILLLSISLFTIGCKTSESISKRKIEEVQEKVKVIELFESTSTRDEDMDANPKEGDMDEVVSVREYAGMHRLGNREVSLKFWKKGMASLSSTCMTMRTHPSKPLDRFSIQLAEG